MNYQHIKNKVDKEYLGYCPEKGWVYSVPVGPDEYNIIAVREGTVEVLITFKVRKKAKGVVNNG